MTDSDAPQYFDLITTGRIGVDLYPLETGVPPAKVETSGKFLGGSTANGAVAAARLGRATAVVTRTGDDPFGARPHEAFKGSGVDDLLARAVPPGDAPAEPALNGALS